MAPLFSGEGTEKSTSPLEVFPNVWAEEGPPGAAKNHAPIVVDLRPGATPVTYKQYPVSGEAHLGVQGQSSICMTLAFSNPGSGSGGGQWVADGADRAEGLRVAHQARRGPQRKA